MAQEQIASPVTLVGGVAQGRATQRLLRRITGFMEDAVLLVLVILVIPLAIFLVGTPVALLVRTLIEIAKRL